MLAVSAFNFLAFFLAKSKIMDLFEGNDKALQIYSLNNFFTGVIVNTIIEWVVGYLHRMRFDNIAHEQLKTLHKLKTVQCKTSRNQ